MNSRADLFMRGVLVVNGIADIVMAAIMVFLPGQLTRFLGLRLTDDFVYVAGGWGVAAASFGAMRLFAGLAGGIETGWFVAAFGALEGVLLTVFSLAVPAITPLVLRNVWLSAGFAFFFAVAYGFAFLLRERSKRRA
jgi:hypothetical protein